MSDKITIYVKAGKYQGQILQADAIGPDGAFVRFNNQTVIETIKEGDFDVIEPTGGIPEAFDSGDTMHVPESIAPLKTGGIFTGKIEPIPFVGERITPLKPGFLEKAFKDAIDPIANAMRIKVFNETMVTLPKLPIPEIRIDIDDLLDRTAETKIPEPVEVPLEEWDRVLEPITGDLEPSVENVGDNVDSWAMDPRTLALSKNNDELRAIIKGLRIRSKRKGESNTRLSNELDQARVFLSEQGRDMDGLIYDNNLLKERIAEKDKLMTEARDTIAKMLRDIRKIEKDRDEWKRLNEYHKAEVVKGNEYREGIKRTVEELHKSLEAKNKTIMDAEVKTREAEAELDRFKRIVDALTGKRLF